MHNAALYANNPALLFNKAKNKNSQFSILNYFSYLRTRYHKIK